MSTIYRSINAIILSFLFCGAGQIYLRKIAKGLVLILSFWFAVAIIWIGVYGLQTKPISFWGKDIGFSSLKQISLGKQLVTVGDIMKVTGAIQLVFTWIFGIIDAWNEGRK